MKSPERSVLTRVGLVLIVAGLLDTGFYIHSLIRGTSYLSCLNLFAIITGFFLLAGNLRAALIVRVFGLFLITAFLVSPFSFLVIQPLGLTWVQLQQEPASLLVAWSQMAVTGVIYAWVVWQLGLPVVQNAWANKPFKLPRPKTPVYVGFGVVATTTVYFLLQLGGPEGAHAIALAQQKVGSNYRFCVTNLNFVRNNEGSFISGEVAAWNNEGLVRVPVQWVDQ